MTAIHQITGYSKQTKRVVHEITIPVEHLGYVRDVFDVSKNDDPELSGGAYPLPDGRLNQLAYYLQDVAEPEACQWFLEAYEEPSAALG